jgi:hypothetical protein
MSAIEDVTNTKRAFFKAVPAMATKSPGFNQWMLNPEAQQSSLGARVGRSAARKLNPWPQMQPIPLSNLLGPAVARRSEEDERYIPNDLILSMLSQSSVRALEAVGTKSRLTPC